MRPQASLALIKGWKHMTIDGTTRGHVDLVYEPVSGMFLPTSQLMDASASVRVQFGLR
jgi:hypothetical protein